MQETSLTTKVVFLAYIAAVFAIAVFSHRVLSKKTFMAEYFLGSRGLGTWALAFTFAATSASGGSFGGYPSLIYSFGWVLALWIGSYMIFPLTTMGVIGKRLNEVARKSGAITIPDVLRDRFDSTTVGLLASVTIICFNSCMLVAQFKLGALIVEDTFNLHIAHGYAISLGIFAVTVVFYTAYGGFRAVVWTDVMQGVVMGIGIVLLIPVVLTKISSLPEATRALQDRPPTLVTSVPGPGKANGTYNDVALLAVGDQVPAGMVYRKPSEPNSPLSIDWKSEQGAQAWIDVSLQSDSSGKVISTGNDVRLAIEEHATLSQQIRVELPYKNDWREEIDGEFVSRGATGVIWFPEDKREYRFGFVHGDELLFGPGRKAGGAPFHPLGMAISFFFIWAIIGIAQPGMMVRLMAFRDSRTLRRSIMTVSIYYALIYVPLIVIVMAARSKLPILTSEDSDRTIVLIATRLVSDLGPFYQVMGAILVAAPFAAVMSTVDSFLLQISSSAVRDVYQRTINPRVTERTVKVASYTATVVVGVVVSILALNPPNFLQVIIVFASAGFAATFLCPMVLGLYWPGMTRAGAISSMVGGFAIVVGLMAWGEVHLFGLHPAIWGLVGSFTLGIVVSKLSGAPRQDLIEKYFYEPSDKKA